MKLQPIQLNKHTHIYCGFTIRRAPIVSKRKSYRYLVMQQDNYYGMDFTLSEACQTIDRIKRGKQFINKNPI